LHGGFGLISLLATVFVASGGNLAVAIGISAASLIAALITVATSSALISRP
jgi:hypothetical protein